MWGWLRRAARRASLRNILRNSPLSARLFLSVLQTTSLLKPFGPCATARRTVALAPSPISTRVRYLLSGTSAAGDTSAILTQSLPNGTWNAHTRKPDLASFVVIPATFLNRASWVLREGATSTYTDTWDPTGLRQPVTNRRGYCSRIQSP